MKDDHLLSVEERTNLDTYQACASSWTQRAVSRHFPEALTEFQRIYRGKRLLDIGCGPAHHGQEFLKNGYGYVGIDLCPNFLEEAKARVPVESLFCMNMRALGFRNESFDGAWAAASFLHLPKRFIRLALREVWRILVPGGIAGIVLKEGSGEGYFESFDEHPRFFAYYRFEEFCGIINECGFKLIWFNGDKGDYNPSGNQIVWNDYFIEKM